MFNIAIHKNFTKGVQKAKLNPTNTAKLFLYISLLLNEEDLPTEAKDHSLTGNYKDTKEFHISGDLLDKRQYIRTFKNWYAFITV